MLQDLSGMKKEFEEDIKGSYGFNLAKGVVRGQAQLLQNKYGVNPDGRSHGESFIHLFKERPSLGNCIYWIQIQLLPIIN